MHVVDMYVELLRSGEGEERKEGRKGVKMGVVERGGG